MSSPNQRLASSTEKRPSVAGLQSKKLGSAAKNRVALGYITNQVNGYDAYVESSMNVETMSIRAPLECLESFDEILPTFGSLESLELEYLESEDALVSESIETKAVGNLMRERLKQKKDSIAHVIYQNSHDSEVYRLPRAGYMEMVQEDITDYMQATTIDWLVRVSYARALSTASSSHYYNLPLFLSTEQLQLVVVTCMMIAWIHFQSSLVSTTTHINIFSLQILQMESAVLNYLKFEMMFMEVLPNYLHDSCKMPRQFVSAAEMANQVSFIYSLLSLVEYTMLHYGSSIIAASAALLARFLLSPLEQPWDYKLRDFTLYSNLGDRVKALHHLYRDGGIANLVALSEK
ncbi:hypothetical protein GOBAR_AA33470 [Gossypium barbadense]|uniref:Cyclin C-terminal domain-containing protein n=1 Tax=Gossypium barbadense TaxID=3634 RepID=A0A2P5W7Z6_GOSBA|nr:hypothetical protein GOBAR_AA33470 [Gossypium barbadense]